MPAIVPAIDIFHDLDLATYLLLNTLPGQPIVHLSESAAYRYVDFRYRRQPSLDTNYNKVHALLTGTSVSAGSVKARFPTRQRTVV